MTNELAQQLLGAAISLVVALLGALAWYIRRRTGQLEYHITNDHDKELRTDLDDKHDELVSLVIHQQKETSKDIGGIRQEIRYLREGLDKTRERLESVEDTERRNHPS